MTPLQAAYWSDIKHSDVFFSLYEEKGPEEWEKLSIKLPGVEAICLSPYSFWRAGDACLRFCPNWILRGYREKMWALMGSKWEESITCMLSQIPQDLGFVNRDWPGALLQENRGCSLPGLWHADPCTAPAPPAAPALCRPQSQPPGECPPDAGWGRQSWLPVGGIQNFLSLMGKLTSLGAFAIYHQVPHFIKWL